MTNNAGIDAGQPRHRNFCDNITYTDRKRGNHWRAIASSIGSGKSMGYDGDHLSLIQFDKLKDFPKPSR